MTNQQLSSVVEKVLRQALVDLTDLSLLDKQAYWNIKGSRFHTLHLWLGGTVDEVRVASDDVAKRLAALDGVPDARIAIIAATLDLKQLGASYLSADEVYSQFEELLITVSNRIKATLGPVNGIGHLSNGILISIATGLKRQAWMLRSAAANG